jgi:hypothetical protein
MERGLMVIEKTDTETKGFYIDQDALECARLNAKVNKRLAEAEQAKQEAARKHRKAEAIKAKRKAYTKHTAGYVLSRLAVCTALVWAGTAGLIHPVVYIPVALVSLCAACLRLGALFGKVVAK